MGQLLLLRDAHRKLLASLAPTTTEHLAPGPRLHALAETMGSLAALAVGLKSSLHGDLRDSCGVGRGELASHRQAVKHRAAFSHRRRTITFATAFSNSRTGPARRRSRALCATTPTSPTELRKTHLHTWDAAVGERAFSTHAIAASRMSCGLPLLRTRSL